MGCKKRKTTKSNIETINVTTLSKREKQIWEEPGKEHLMPIACHDDNLTDEEKDFMDEAIAEYERTHKK